ALRVQVLPDLRELGVLLLDLALELVVQALDLVARALELVLAAFVLLEEARVLDRDRRLVGEALEEGQVVLAEEARLEAVVDVDAADAQVADAERDAEQRSELELGDAAGRGQVGVAQRVGGDDRLAGAEDLLRDRVAHLELRLADRLAVEVARDL